MQLSEGNDDEKEEEWEEVEEEEHVPDNQGIQWQPEEEEDVEDEEEDDFDENLVDDLPPEQEKIVRDIVNNDPMLLIGDLETNAARVSLEDFDFTAHDCPKIRRLLLIMSRERGLRA